MKAFISVALLASIAFPLGIGEGNQDPCRTQPIGERHGPYLGETPPGSDPKIFAPDLVSSACSEHSVPIFSPDGREAVWTRMVEGNRKARILYTREEASGWTEPGIATFITGSDGYYPFFSTHGEELYYVSRDLFSRSLKMAQREGDDWSRPKKVGAPMKGNQLMWSASISGTGTVYFVLRDDRGLEQIYRARKNARGYGDGERLGVGVNPPAHSASTPFIAPDESYLLFSSSRPGGAGAWDLFVSSPTADGSWSDACNLGPTVNTEAIEHSPGVTPDGKYLFFIRGTDVFWVNAEIIGRAREGECGARPFPSGLFPQPSMKRRLTRVGKD